MTSIIIVYDYFYPAYKAGGPVQSLTNLVVILKKHINFVICGAVDLHSKTNLGGISTNEWSTIKLPPSDTQLNVWYAVKLNKAIFSKCLQDVSPAVVYLNGMFSFRFVIIPLLTIDKSKIKIVLCPRGMLQNGALAGKSLKKKLYIAALKFSGLVKNIDWHATNAEEEQDIKSVFGNKANVIVAPNIPKSPVNKITRSEKATDQLRLIYLSLIAEKKNLLQVIELVNKLAANVTLDIYGPVKDAAYWKKCEQAIATSNGKIKYMGDLRPEQVQDTFAKYDASIILTKGENFGHALYESLSVGRPLITSFFTPWNDLEEKKAGWNLDISNTDDCIKKLEVIASIDNDSFNVYCNGAYELAKGYYAESADLSNYHKLFG